MAKKNCENNNGGIKSVILINKSDIKDFGKSGELKIKRKYGKFKREIHKFEL